MCHSFSQNMFRNVPKNQAFLKISNKNILTVWAVSVSFKNNYQAGPGRVALFVCLLLWIKLKLDLHLYM